MKDLTKSGGGGKSAVRQVKGPGMNLGLKKPRKNYIAKPKPYKQSKALKDAEKVGKGKSSSYLSDLGGGGNVQAMGSGKGKNSLAKLR